MAAQAPAPTIEQQVKEIISRVLLIDEEQLTPKALLGEDLGMDSLDRAELELCFEEELLPGGNILDRDAVDQWQTLEDIVNSVKQAAGKKR